MTQRIPPNETPEGISLDHFRMARTCHRFFFISWCRTAWNKHVTLPSGVSDHSLAKMCNFMAVPSMSLSDCTMVTDVNLSHLIKLPLQQLDLSRCTNITDACLFHMKYLHIQVLNLYYCHKITDEGLVHLKHLPFIQKQIKRTKLAVNTPKTG